MLCAGTSLPLDVSAVGGLISWQNGSQNPVFTVTKAGTYWVNICRDGCAFQDSIRVSYLSALQVELGPDQTLCEPAQPVSLQASFPGANYQWSDGSQDSSLTVSETGTYWVRVSHACGVVSDTVRITYEPTPVVEFGPDTTLCVGDTLRLDARSANSRSYRWSNGSTQPTLLVTTSGRYGVEATNQTCVARNTIHVNFVECPEKLFVPNVFTPNGDAHNETFEIAGILPGKWQLEVYNRFGKEVYTTTGYRNDWRAEGLDNGLYFYLLREPSSERSYKGWVQVLR